MIVAENPRAVIGSNLPPKEMTAFDAVKANIDDLYDEAKNWLDGEPVTDKAQADALNTLQARIREAGKEAEKQRKVDAKPFDDGKAAVQLLYKPILNKADQAEAAVKAALKPYLVELDRQQQEAARLAREEATRKQREAADAMRMRDAANLAQREDAEKLVEEAKAAAAAAHKAENAKAHAKGEGRATGLRTIPRPVLVDARQAAAWVWVDHNDALMAWVQDLAEKAVRSGSRKIPGFDVIEEKVL